MHSGGVVLALYTQTVHAAKVHGKLYRSWCATTEFRVFGRVVDARGAVLFRGQTELQTLTVQLVALALRRLKRGRCTFFNINQTADSIQAKREGQKPQRKPQERSAPPA